MRPSQPLRILSSLACVCCATCSVSAQSLPSNVRFTHRTEARTDGKTTLVVTPLPGMAQDQAIIERAAQDYADAFARKRCRKGYDFYAHAALLSRRGEKTFVFQCK
jgi:hypothetical protein